MRIAKLILVIAIIASIQGLVTAQKASSVKTYNKCFKQDGQLICI